MCYTWSKVLEISRKSALTSWDGFELKDDWISWVNWSSWYMQESCDRKPDWYLVNKLLEKNYGK